MNNDFLYPMQLSPVCRSTIWGGNRMRDCFGFQTKLNNIAEAWMLSSRDDSPCFVVNGMHFAERLDSILSEHPELLSSKADSSVCPLLIKFIDARDKLSIQVHPDDAYAEKKGIGRGKTEMWIILEASLGAEIIYGTREDFTPETLRASIEDNTLSEKLRHVPVHAGDVFFIPAGLIHAIGAGILLAEIQENCDTTYRVYDYNRKQDDGSLRPLHIDDAVACAKYYTDAEIDALRYENGDRTALADSPLFRVSLQTVSESADFTVGDSFVSLLVPSGEGVLSCRGEEYPLAPGMSYFLPAGLGTCRLSGKDGSSVTVILSR